MAKLLIVKREDVKTQFMRTSGAIWREAYYWDKVSREVEMIRARIEAPMSSSQRWSLWNEALETDLAEILEERIGGRIEKAIKRAQRHEWDTEIVDNLDSLRAKDKVVEAKLAFLV
jgi:hypothetical protein